MTVGEARNGSTGKDSEQAMRSAEDNLTRGLRLLVIPHLSRHPSPGERLFSYLPARGTDDAWHKLVLWITQPLAFSHWPVGRASSTGNVRISSHSLKEGGLVSSLALGGAHLLRDSMRDLGPTAIPNQGKQASLITDTLVAATETLDLRWYPEGTTDHDTRRSFRRTFFHTQN